MRGQSRKKKVRFLSNTAFFWWYLVFQTWGQLLGSEMSLVQVTVDFWPLQESGWHSCCSQTSILLTWTWESFARLINIQLMYPRFP